VTEADQLRDQLLRTIGTTVGRIPLSETFAAVFEVLGTLLACHPKEEREAIAVALEGRLLDYANTTAANVAAGKLDHSTAGGSLQ
jgi:hypothetical protein